MPRCSAVDSLTFHHPVASRSGARGTGGEIVNKGDLIGEIGATGRATGPHLDWLMNWLDKRVDPQLLMDGDPAPID